ncbi:MAG: cysteine desulfurase family protein, partial [Thermodesulfobacteriota bacterium]
PAGIEPALCLLSLGAQVTFVPPDGGGLIDPAAIEKALRPGTALVSVMLANNETGVLQPVAEIGRLTRARGVLLHTDAAQAVGKIGVDVAVLGVDLLSVAGHKLYAPKGVGALYVRRGVELEPFLHGAGQESGRRAGTENVALAAALGEACRLAGERLAEDIPRLAALRNRLWEKLAQGLPGLVLVGGEHERLPNTLNVCVPGRLGSEVLARAPEVRASTGAACHSGQVKVSPVLQAMGLDPEIAQGAIRLSLGRSTTAQEVDRAVAALVRAARE